MFGKLNFQRLRCNLKGTEVDPESIRVELTLESDLFFHFTHTTTPSSFKVLQQEQHLKVDFSTFTALLIKMANGTIREPHRYSFFHFSLLVLYLL